MDKIEVKRNFWNHVMIGGLVAGGMLSLSVLIAHLFRGTESGVIALINNIITLSAVIIVPFRFGRDYSRNSGDAVFTFPRAVGYMLILYFLAAFINGFFTFIIYNLDIEYYANAFATVAELVGAEGAADFEHLASSPLTMSLSFMSTVPLLAFVPSMIIAAIIRKK